MDIQTIISQIDLGSYALPEFQRGYVWNREQVKKLMNSLYRGYPIGSLLVWVTETDADIVRGDGVLTPGSVNLILDGQQRVTSLYGIIKGKPPMFFDGNASAFTDLYFNLVEESFEFFAPIKMKEDPNWICVTELMKVGAGNYVLKSKHKEFFLSQLDKLQKIDNIKNVDLHVQQVAGPDKTIDVVVEIFNNVNSGGTKLSKGDLALAKICSVWSNARAEMRKILSRLSTARYSFELDWLLRCVTVYTTGKPYFSALAEVQIDEFKAGLKDTEKIIDTILNQIGSRLGLDHDRVLGSRYSIPLLVGYARKHGMKGISGTEWNKLLYWYIHTFLWGRYAGSTESVLAQDLNVLDNGEGVDGLIKLLRQNRGDLSISANDFTGWSTGSRFYPLLYLLTRTQHAKDWGNGLELSNALLGKFSSLEVHHIFPKDHLYKALFTKAEVNSLGNYVFLTKETNLEISNKEPKDYLPVYNARNPGAIETHAMPAHDPDLLKVDNYLKFLEARRKLLASWANEYLNGLLAYIPKDIVIENFANRELDEEPESPEEDTILEVSYWMEEKGLPGGFINHELLDEAGNLVTIMDLAWPNGIQEGFSEPVALLINEEEKTHNAVSRGGYKYFTSKKDFFMYVNSTYLQS